MAGPLPRRTRWLAVFVVGVTLVLGVATGVFWEDLRRTALDPKVPFQTYDPPPAPHYGEAAAWWLLPARPAAPGPGDPAVDVFFISPTVYDGGRQWNMPVDDAGSDALFRRRMAPNYAGPFLRIGRIFAPRYRQASLYSLLTLREDAREARRFAYGDVAQAFRTYVTRYNRGRPLVIVGVEQGGTLAARLIMEEVALDPDLRGRLVAAYLQETVVPADAPPIPACEGPGQTGCLAAWASLGSTEFDRAKVLLDRALIWAPGGELENLHGRPALCFNPILSATTGEPAPARLHRGAANATDLEWGARPAFMARQVSARCEGGVLRVSAPKSSALKRTGSWADRRKVPGYNLFYADLEADAKGRVEAFLGR
jgi:hypothetical protein